MIKLPLKYKIKKNMLYMQSDNRRSANIISAILPIIQLPNNKLCMYIVLTILLT